MHHHCHESEYPFVPTIEDEKLYCIAVISNPKRYKRRYELYNEFAARMEATPNVILYTVEMAYADRPHVVTSPCHPRHIQIRSRQELWHKENMINIGIAHLPASAKYIAWIDADVKFIREDWATEAIHKLQHHPVVQLFTHCTMLGPKQHPDQHAISFAYAYHNSLESFDKKVKVTPLHFGGYGGTPYKTGLGWAYRREALVALGGMMDTCIIGSADYHMAAAFIGRAGETIPADSSEPYRQLILSWQHVAHQLIKGNIGYVDGSVVHFWHGEMKDRRYRERWVIVNEFDPNLDLIRDWTNHGLLQLLDHGPRTRKIEQYLKEYFNLRNEDSI